MALDRPDLSREQYNFLIKIGQITPADTEPTPEPTKEN